MELVGAYSDRALAHQIAQKLGARVVSDPREETSHLPFAALVSVDSDDAEDLIDADVGVYLCYRREQKVNPARTPDDQGRLPGKIALFPMVRHPNLSHRESDDHWRDTHTPIALRVHTEMSFYTQLAVVHTLRGPEVDGFAQCGFDSIDDLRTKFYAGPEGQREVEKDVNTFANPKASPRRLICDEYKYPREI